MAYTCVNTVSLGWELCIVLRQVDLVHNNAIGGEVNGVYREGYVDDREVWCG